MIERNICQTKFLSITDSLAGPIWTNLGPSNSRKTIGISLLDLLFLFPITHINKYYRLDLSLIPSISSSHKTRIPTEAGRI